MHEDSRGTTTLVINDSSSRRVARFALWSIVATEVVGRDELSEAFDDRAWGEIHPIYLLEPNPGRAEFRMLRIAALSAAARTISSVPDGARVELPASHAEIVRALRECVRAIDQNIDLFLGMTADGREDVLRCRRAAVRLLGELRGESSDDSVCVPAFSGAVSASRAPVAEPLHTTTE